MIPIKLDVATVYEPNFLAYKTHPNSLYRAIMYAPRDCGKTYSLQQLITFYYDRFPDCDIAVFTDRKTDMKQRGTFAGFKQFLIKNCPAQEIENWVFVGDKFYRRNRNQLPNEVKMFNIQGVDEADVNVSKDRNTDRPISLIIIDECQLIHNQDILENALATFGRQLREGHAAIVIAGNPDEKHIWFTDYFNMLELDEEWVTISPTYKDIINRLPAKALALIKNLEKNFPEKYRKIYLGIMNGLNELTAYSTFREDRHVKDRKDCDDSKIQYFFVGIDYASAADALTAVPCPLLYSGRVCVIAERFRYSPKLTHSAGLAPSQQAKLMAQYLMFLDKKYQITYNEVPIVLSIDSAADTFAKQMQLLKDTDWVNRQFWDNVVICKYGKLKNKNKGVELVKDAFAFDAVEIMRDDTQYQFYNKKEGMIPKRDQLIWELQNVKWKNELGTKVLNKKDENDMADALEYGLAPIFTDCHNLKDIDGKPFKVQFDSVAFNFDYKAA